MLRYYKRKSAEDLASSPSKRGSGSSNVASSLQPSVRGSQESDMVQVPQPQPPITNGNDAIMLTEAELEHLPTDPGLRKPIMDYHANVRNQVRRAYLQIGPCQPRNHDFPYSRKRRKFCSSWFDAHEDWLEYSVSKDRVYCLYCYLFRCGGPDNFADAGYRTWSKKDRLQVHVGGPGSAHNTARKSCQDLLNERVHIDTKFARYTDEDRRQYRIRLKASVQTTRILLRQGIAFRGNDESEKSTNKGNFKEFLEWLGNNSEELKPYILGKAPKNHKLTSPKIQKDITKAFSFEIISEIIRDMGDSLFSILVDESKDNSSKEQMAIVLRYVKEGLATTRIEIFYAVLDLQLRELNDRFTETGTELLLCIACLCPSNSFSAFDKDKLKRLARFYPRDFSKDDLEVLDDQLENYITDMRSSVGFSELNGITDLAQKMVETKKDKVYPHVYLLLTLALILPVATASVERLFSAMKIIKNRLRNRMGDDWLNDCLLAYVEKVIMDGIADGKIMKRFQVMKKRKRQM